MELRTAQQSHRWRLLLMSSLSALEDTGPGYHLPRLNPAFFLEVLLQQKSVDVRTQAESIKNILTTEAIHLRCTRLMYDEVKVQSEG